MRRTPRAAAVTAATITLLAATTVAARADGTTKTDPVGDAPAAVDLTRAVYVNGPAYVTAKLTVRSAKYGTRFDLFIGSVPGGHHGYDAGVRFTATGEPVTTLTYSPIVDRPAARVSAACDVRATLTGNSVTIRVPDTCLPKLSVKRLYLEASAGRGRDFAPAARHLRRG